LTGGTATLFQAPGVSAPIVARVSSAAGVSSGPLL
jgi:hypothetical protein